MIVLDLVYKLALLVTFSIISGFISGKFSKKRSTHQILQGLLFGIASCIGMYHPFILDKGIFFDGRSVVISLCTLFFGPEAGLITATMSILYRVYLGGSGAVMGSMVIISSFLIGYFFHLRVVKKAEKELSWKFLYLFGIVVHLAMLILIITLPGKYIVKTYKTVAITVIGFYPVITVLIGKILTAFENNRKYIGEIRESESLYRTTLYSIGDALITTDLSGSIRHMNGNAELLTGLKESDARNRSLYKIIKVVTEAQRKPFVLPVTDPAGEFVAKDLYNAVVIIGQDVEKPVSLSIASIVREDGTKIGFVLAFRDQTQEQKMQRALMESEQRYRQLLESAPVGIAVHTDESITYINSLGSRLLGADAPGRVVGKHISSFVKPHNLEFILTRIQKLLNGENINTPIETKFVRLDEIIIDVEVMATPIFQKGIPAIQFIFIDISKRKTAENEIKRLNLELEQIVELRTALLVEANKELEAYSYSVSHDLRAPLRAIDGFTRYLDEDYGRYLDDDGRGIIQIIRQNSKRMGQLIDDLLNFSRFNTVKVKSVQVDMYAIVNDVYNELISSYSSKPDFVCEKLETAHCDESLIRQVWTNLISNAIKYSLGIETACIKVGCQKDNGMLNYYVRDNGIGFDMKYAEKLYGVFQRLHSTREFSGTGVGLAIVKRIVERMGGRVWADGEVNKGATFWFSLPS